MKYLFELILTTIIIFFIWNILKRFFKSFFFGQFSPPRDARKEKPGPDKSKKLNTKINWDAETVEYEEIKEDTSHKN